MTINETELFFIFRTKSQNTKHFPNKDKAYERQRKRWTNKEVDLIIKKKKTHRREERESDRRHPCRTN